MSIIKALELAKKELLHSKFSKDIRPSLEAELLLSFVLDCTREWLHTWGESELKPSDFDEFMQCVQRRKAGEPVEYITQSAGFYGNTFYVDNRVLIPRPESEILVEQAKSLIESKGLSKIAEIGTGSGIIAIMLGILCPKISITATDISKDALKVAQINLDRFATRANNLKDRIRFVHTNLLDNLSDIPELLVSNPPYIANDYPLPKNVLYEPFEALFGGEVGDEVLKSIIKLCKERNILYLACEIGYDQKATLEAYLEENNFTSIFYKDLNNLDRGFLAKSKNHL